MSTPSRSGTPVRDRAPTESVDAPEISATPRRFAFSPLEEAIVHSERRWPITIQLEAHVRERVDPQRLERAVEIARRTHPLASVRRSPRSRWSRVQIWERLDGADVEPIVVTACNDETTLAALRDRWYSTRLSIDQAPPFRLLLARLPDRDALLLSAHHGAFDGIGALTLLRTIRSAYATMPAVGDRGDATSGDPFSEIERRVHLPASGREHARDDVGGATKAWRERVAGAMAPVRSVFTAPESLRLARCGGVSTDNGYGIVLDRLDLADTKALQQSTLIRAIEGATVNDVLIAALHRTIALWDERLSTTDGRVTVTMPVTTRRPNERNSIVANLTLQASTATTPEDRRDPRALLAAITRQTARAKQGGDAHEPAASPVGSFLPSGVRSRIPEVVSWITRDRFLDSSRLSNLGRHGFAPFADGGFGIDHLWFSPPVRMPQGLTVGALTCNGSLHLAFRSCHALWDADAAKEFRRFYREALDDFA